MSLKDMSTIREASPSYYGIIEEVHIHHQRDELCNVGHWPNKKSNREFVSKAMNCEYDVEQVYSPFTYLAGAAPYLTGTQNNSNPHEYILPIIVSRVSWAGRGLHAVNGDITFVVQRELDGYRFYFINDSRFGLRVFAESREELERELPENMFMLWDTYANERIDVLTRNAAKIKYMLKEAFQEV
jgi:hypothetical protein